MTQHVYQFLYGPGSLNLKLFQVINHDCATRFLDHLMPLFTYLGGSWMVYIYALILSVWAALDRKRMPWRYPAVFIAGALLGIVLEEGLKQLLQVPRPAAALGLAKVRVLGEVKLRNSLPSGHAVFSAMLASVLGRGRGMSWRIPLWSFVAAVCVSRIYVGAHYPLDVLAGGVVGTLAGCAAWQAADAVTRMMGTGQRR